MTTAVVVPNNAMEIWRPITSVRPHRACASDLDITTCGTPSAGSAAANTPPTTAGIRNVAKYALSTKRTSVTGDGARASSLRAASPTFVAGAQQANGLVVAMLTEVTPGIARARART